MKDLMAHDSWDDITVINKRLLDIGLHHHTERMTYGQHWLLKVLFRHWYGCLTRFRVYHYVRQAGHVIHVRQAGHVIHERHILSFMTEVHVKPC